MATFFFDSSGLVKRYVKETGSAWVIGITDPTTGHRIQLARITGVEVISGITRRERAGGLSAADATLIRTHFRHDLAHQYRPVAITAALIASAMSLAEVHALRSHDAVQWAAALRSNTRRIAQGGPGLTLISADAALNVAAIAEGLTVDDPNTHP